MHAKTLKVFKFSSTRDFFESQPKKVVKTHILGTTPLLKGFHMKIIEEITPSTYACLLGACPSIFVTDAGSYVVVGRQLDRAEQPTGKVGAGEAAIEISRDLIDQAVKSYMLRKNAA
jgi:hypothetical protein